MLVPAITKGGRQQYREVINSIRPQRNIRSCRTDVDAGDEQLNDPRLLSWEQF